MTAECKGIVRRTWARSRAKIDPHITTSYRGGLELTTPLELRRRRSACKPAEPLKPFLTRDGVLVRYGLCIATKTPVDGPSCLHGRISCLRILTSSQIP